MGLGFVFFVENFYRIRQPCQINKGDNGKDETEGQTTELRYQKVELSVLVFGSLPNPTETLKRTEVAALRCVSFHPSLNTATFCSGIDMDVIGFVDQDEHLRKMESSIAIN